MFIWLLHVAICAYFTNGKISRNQHRYPYYAASIDPSQKFLPRILEYNNNNKNNVEANELECQVRQTAYTYAQQIQPFRGQQKDTLDALNLPLYCDASVVDKYKSINNNNMIYHSNKAILNMIDEYTVYVDATNGNDNNNGSITSPFASIYAALHYLRSYKSNDISKQIIIRNGILFLNETINLSPTTYDNNLLIRSYPNENVTISGGIHINISSLNWQRYNDGNSSHNIWMAPIDNNINLFNNTILSLFTLTPHTRLTRARYPNGHAEIWYNGAYYLNPNWVNTWWLPPIGTQYSPKQIFKDFSNCSNTSPCLNHSQYQPFNTYTAGYGGVCDLWTPSYSYWCGKNCAGGLGQQDESKMATGGKRNLPIGMTYNISLLPEIALWGNDIETGIFQIHHSAGWNVFWYEVGDIAKIDTKIGNISFGKGGFQGGRVWLNTSEWNDKAVVNVPIMAGPWLIENVLAILDTPNEWYFNKSSRILYYWPNNTKPGESPADANIDLVIGNLSTLFNLESNNHLNQLKNVSFEDLNFRDTRYTYLDPWCVPSGGDWAYYNGGAFKFENTSDCAIKSSSFTRLDGNCIALFGYNRNTTISQNLFQYIGDNVIGALGETDDYDGTNGLQPRFTNIVGNLAHDIGVYQLQSSLWFQAKSCQNYIANNIVFNVPRAAMLFNDAFGGSNQVIANLLFNTCTASSDHGPINSWNRVPFLTNVAYGFPSFDAGYTNVALNFIFANYGGSQGWDTDDGSAWYNIYDNFFYDAMGYKNDYGGYNVNYFNNINIALYGNEYNCWEIEPVNLDGPGNHMHDNKCIVFQCPNKDNPNCDVVQAIWPSNLQGALKQYNNQFYTPHVNATIQTWAASGQNWVEVYLSPQQMYQKYGLSYNSTQNPVPSVAQIIIWVKALLQIP